MRPITAEQVRESLEWLDWYERGQLTQPELAKVIRISQGHLSRRLALARRYRLEEERQGLRIDLALAPGTGPDDDRAEVGDDEPVWLELVDRSDDARPSDHPFYDLATDRSSHDGTGSFVLVGTGRGGQPRRNRLGTGRHVDNGQRYRGEDDGMKGGVG